LPPTPAPDLSASRGTNEEPLLQGILDHLLAAKGFDASQYKRNYIKRRIAVRMRATGASTYEEYNRILKLKKEEAGLLLDRLTIHVTGFFRDPAVFRALKERFFSRPLENGPFRVWSAGCSTGEEAYSTAIALKDWALEHPPFPFEIWATDIDSQSVGAAERAQYPVAALGKMDRAHQSRWFYVQQEKAVVAEDLKKHVRFRTHDLLGDWPLDLARFDLILCRNVLIYMTAPQQQILYERFAQSLVAGGFLVLGLTETLMGKARNLYQCVDVRHRIYRTLLVDPTKEDAKVEESLG
jgi:chemotaxis methyl-accepting protein methylase